MMWLTQSSLADGVCVEKKKRCLAGFGCLSRKGAGRTENMAWRSEPKALLHDNAVLENFTNVRRTSLSPECAAEPLDNSCHFNSPCMSQKPLRSLHVALLLHVQEAVLVHLSAE